jgi:hypothetical protein
MMRIVSRVFGNTLSPAKDKIKSEGRRIYEAVY